MTQAQVMVLCKLVRMNAGDARLSFSEQLSEDEFETLLSLIPDDPPSTLPYLAHTRFKASQLRDNPVALGKCVHCGQKYSDHMEVSNRHGDVTESLYYAICPNHTRFLKEKRHDHSTGGRRKSVEPGKH